MLACVPLSDTNDPPAAAKSSVSFSAAAVVSSLQLEISSSFAITTIGAVIRLATEAAPTKAEAEASAGYVSLGITADNPRKFSISQHYTTNFTDGLTLADVLAPNTQYKLYLFFEPNTIPSETTLGGATLHNDVAALLFTTAILSPLGDTVWNNAWANNQFVGSLPEWGYSQNQKGIFVAYTKINLPIVALSFTTRAADDTFLQSMGSISFGSARPSPGFLFDMSKLGGSYPDVDDYYYVISVDDTEKISGKVLQMELTSGSTTKIKIPIARYSSP
ncbi:hypothetical protein P0082_05785 [Candidatus Haliotispira prima]|uniref:Uncharacterized protein n=1 Tax=Candidatus Haliotispira prima TaxID=3034016 RepID=A0ABY8MK18_9SPIO|nr:hypothetical protein P0082_05785 [Candidatus Haliotispira prima]